MFVLPSFLRFFLFLSKQDCYGAKDAFVSSRFENPLLRTLYFLTAFNSKHKICHLNFSWMTKQFFNISITIFTSSTEDDCLHITTLETVPSDKKSNYCTCCTYNLSKLNPLQEHRHENNAMKTWGKPLLFKLFSTLTLRAIFKAFSHIVL